MDTKAIRARCDAATKGPWDADMWLGILKHAIEADAMVDRRALAIIADWPTPGVMNDAAFIAHARTDLPACLDTIEAQAQRIEALEKLITPIPCNACKGTGEKSRLAFSGAGVTPCLCDICRGEGAVVPSLTVKEIRTALKGTQP